jgi:hypothetical protein
MNKLLFIFALVLSTTAFAKTNHGMSFEPQISRGAGDREGRGAGPGRGGNFPALYSTIAKKISHVAMSPDLKKKVDTKSILDLVENGGIVVDSGEVALDSLGYSLADKIYVNSAEFSSIFKDPNWDVKIIRDLLTATHQDPDVAAELAIGIRLTLSSPELDIKI